MNYTNLQQSKRLLELGLNPESADMIYGSYAFDGPPKNGDENLPTTFEDPDTKHWYYVDFMEPFYDEDWAKDKKYKDIPCWSIGALMGIMPLYNGTTPRLSWSKGQCVCFYYCGKAFHNDTIIDACYNMVVWLLENKYI